MDQAKSVRIARDSEDPDKEVDKTALTAALAEADGKAKANYTAESWKALEEAIAMPEETQKQVDAKVAAINAAIDELVEKSIEVKATNVEKGNEYIINSDSITVDFSESENVITIGGTIPKVVESVLGHEPNSNLFEIKITLENVDKETAAFRAEGTKINTYSAEDNWMDGDNFFYFVGAAKDKNSTFTLTIDNDGNWDTTEDAITYIIKIAEEAILG